MTTENVAPKAGFEPTLLVNPLASMLPITLPRHPGAITQSTPTYLCGKFPERSVQTSTLITFDL